MISQLHSFRIFIVFFALSFARVFSFTLMIDPAGDAKTTGRKLDDSFERGITLQCAQELQKRLQKKFPGLNVILTRMPGETVHELQNANFANRMNVDLYVSIHFFHDQATVPVWHIFCYGNGQSSTMPNSEFAFYRYDQAHLINQKKTRHYSHQLYDSLFNSAFAKRFSYQKPVNVPFKPLVGIKAPAFACEIGLQHKESWQSCIEPLTMALEEIIKQK